ncbi:hypothetical protein BEL04_18015 [Mucilaginibacter sp. PPCGB 2223]|uniref:hypothetical protein n=1 Tax=Mucilaginibacter sp. PPCGB 2223 TaxID=1886027 RepID=UPI0008241289|nr:hypothetical protein [Mucilaginibacter sp. PPCGB 2223]OCX51899.1 hypothetical protein BEL04_18015 [Mucilaginibacter sp. PPCGB 2223]
MSASSLIFISIFVVPLVVFLVWLMRQDKRKGGVGLIILAIIIIAVYLYMYYQQNINHQPNGQFF